MIGFFADPNTDTFELLFIDRQGRVLLIDVSERDLDLSTNSINRPTEIKVTRDPGSEIGVNIPVLLK